MVEYRNIIAWHFTCNSQVQLNRDLKGVLLKVKNQRTKEPSAESRLKFDSPWSHVTCETGGEDTRGTFLVAQLVFVFCHRQHWWHQRKVMSKGDIRYQGKRRLSNTAEALSLLGIQYPFSS